MGAKVRETEVPELCMGFKAREGTWNFSEKKGRLRRVLAGGTGHDLILEGSLWLHCGNTLHWGKVGSGQTSCYGGPNKDGPGLGVYIAVIKCNWILGIF